MKILASVIMVIFQSVFGLLFYVLSLLGIPRQTGQLKIEP